MRSSILFLFAYFKSYTILSKGAYDTYNLLIPFRKIMGLKILGVIKLKNKKKKKFRSGPHGLE